MSSPVFIILSAGKSRIRGCNKAIPLIPFNGTKLINRQIAIIKQEYPCAKIVLVAGYKYDEVNSYIKKKHPKVKLVRNKEYLTTSSVASLQLGLKYAGNRDVFIVHGDKVFSRSAIKNRDSSYVSYIGIDKKNDSVGLSFDDDHSLLYMSYGLCNIWSEITLVKKEDLGRLRSTITANVYTLPELINLSEITFEVVLNRNVKSLKEIL